MRESSHTVAGVMALFVGAIVLASFTFSSAPPPTAMAMPKEAFQTHSKDIKMETTELALTLGLKPGMTLSVNFRTQVEYARANRISLRTTRIFRISTAAGARWAAATELS